jgi:Excalibur calcium-binding domain
MLMIAALIAVTPLEEKAHILPPLVSESDYTKKKKRAASSGSNRRFRSCEAARKAGFTHMRRGQAGYSKGLDRDGDGVACDKVK